MNRAQDSLARGPLVIVAALAAALAVLRGLVTVEAAHFFVPAPEQVGQQFFGNLKSHDFGAARDALSDDLRQTVSADDLRHMNERLDRATHGIEQAYGEASQVQDQSATAEVKVKLKNGEEPTVQIPLIQEDGLWHITSLAPLEALSGP